jgi:DICT domain-containing protein
MDREKPKQDVENAISIGELSRLTSVPEATLRMWERRHGVPAPSRLPGGHRRYARGDVELVRHIAAERAAGTPLQVAIAHARARADGPATSIYAELRRRRPYLQPQTLGHAAMLALSRAIEDESLSRAERPVLFGSFQRVRFYRASAARWRELAAGASFAAVFADFPRARHTAGRPVEVPVARAPTFAREWAVVCDAPGHAVCLFGWEPPGRASDRQRRFEAIWSVEPAVVREAARICADVASARVTVPSAVAEYLRSEPPTLTDDQLRLATGITARALADAGR